MCLSPTIGSEFRVIRRVSRSLVNIGVKGYHGDGIAGIKCELRLALAGRDAAIVNRDRISIVPGDICLQNTENFRTRFERIDFYILKVLFDEESEQADVRPDVEQRFAAGKADAVAKVNTILKNLLINVFGLRSRVVKEFPAIRSFKYREGGFRTVGFVPGNESFLAGIVHSFFQVKECAGAYDGGGMRPVFPKPCPGHCELHEWGRSNCSWGVGHFTTSCHNRKIEVRGLRQSKKSRQATGGQGFWTLL